MDTKDQDFIVTSLLTELKEENSRKSATIRGLIKVVFGCFIALILVVGSFLWYLNQYDFTSTEEITATGVYALVDSEGNVIAQDLSDEDLTAVMEVLDGNSESYQN